MFVCLNRSASNEKETQLLHSCSNVLELWCEFKGFESLVLRNEVRPKLTWLVLELSESMDAGEIVKRTGQYNGMPMLDTLSLQGEANMDVLAFFATGFPCLEEIDVHLHQLQNLVLEEIPEGFLSKVYNWTFFSHKDLVNVFEQAPKCLQPKEIGVFGRYNMERDAWNVLCGLESLVELRIDFWPSRLLVLGLPPNLEGFEVEHVTLGTPRRLHKEMAARLAGMQQKMTLSFGHTPSIVWESAPYEPFRDYIAELEIWMGVDGFSIVTGENWIGEGELKRRLHAIIARAKQLGISPPLFDDELL